MSLTRNLVDLYMLATAATKVGSSAIASQSSSLCLHVKTSSLLNPTSMHQGSPEQPIEVPFPNFVEQTSQETLVESIQEEKKVISELKQEPISQELHLKETTIEKTVPPIVHNVDATITTKTIENPTAIDPVVKDILKDEEKKRVLKESHIPTSRLGRLWNYGTLATGMGMGAINESLKRATGLSQDNSGIYEYI